MTTITIRRNAFKKIASILAHAKGVIHYTTWMNIDDSSEINYSVSNIKSAMEWLQENQRGTRVTLHENVLRISGPYWFCDEFTVYLDERKFQDDKKLYVNESSDN